MKEKCMYPVEVPNSAPAIGPYSKAYICGPFVFTSGQLGGSGSIEEQAEACCLAVENVLKAAGANMSQVVKTTCFLSDISDFAAFNQVYARHFISKPARSCFAAKQLPGSGTLCEIEAIAYIG